MHQLEQLIPLATSMIISPLPIAAIIAILLTPRKNRNGIAYVLAFILVSFGFTLVAGLSTHSAGAGGGSGDDTIVLVLGIVLSIGFAALAVASWMSRPKDGAAAKAPGWMAAIDDLSAGRAFLLGIVMGATNAKNIPVELKAGAHIGAADLAPATVVALSAAFAVISSLGVLIPILLAAPESPAVTRVLTRMKNEMIEHNAIIMAVVFALLASVQASHVLSMLVK